MTKRIYLSITILPVVAVEGCANPTATTFGPATVTGNPVDLFWITIAVFFGAILCSAALTALLTGGFGMNAARYRRPGGMRRWRRGLWMAGAVEAMAALGTAWSAYARSGGSTALYLGISLGTVSGLWFAKAVRRRAVASLCEADSQAPVATLVDLMAERDRRIREESTVALAKVLPGATEEELSRLTDRERRVLYRHLAGSDSLLVLAVLGVVERLGDRRALPSVERLVKRNDREDADPRIASAAIRCLERLRLSASQANDARLLVRPAVQSGHPGDTLVRPASGPVEDSTILLRPGKID